MIRSVTVVLLALVLSGCGATPAGERLLCSYPDGSEAFTSGIYQSVWRQANGEWALRSNSQPIRFYRPMEGVVCEVDEVVYNGD